MADKQSFATFSTRWSDQLPKGRKRPATVVTKDWTKERKSFSAKKREKETGGLTFPLPLLAVFSLGTCCINCLSGYCCSGVFWEIGSHRNRKFEIETPIPGKGESRFPFHLCSFHSNSFCLIFLRLLSKQFLSSFFFTFPFNF